MAVEASDSDSDFIETVARRLKINNISSENNTTKQYKKNQCNTMPCRLHDNDDETMLMMTMIYIVTMYL